MAQRTATNLSKTNDEFSGQINILQKIYERKTEELVLGFCGPLGSGVSKVSSIVEKTFKEFKYEVYRIKVSEIIVENIDGVENNIDQLSTGERILKLQDYGNGLRQKYGNDILAKLVVKQISVHREKEIKEELKGGEQGPNVKTRRVITIVDSLKHHEEYELLKTVYGNMFYLFGVLCPEKTREHRLVKNKHVPKEQAYKLMERDKSEEEEYGQKLLKTLHNSDFFIRNNHVNPESLKPCARRYSRLILGDPFISPNKHEYAMYAAQTAALKSSCLSRQVGAAIINENGEIISTGCNDVHKCGGGNYTDDDMGNDARCFKIDNQMCKNDEFKKELFEEIKNTLKDRISTEDRVERTFKSITNLPRLKGLIEYSRAVHAEMDAIVSVARNGGTALKESSIYTTTFPCHHCARHIIAAGIKCIFYIEPYEKSLARDLHSDAIEFDPENGQIKTLSKVYLIPYEGVAPKQYLNLFQSIPGERKKGGRKVEIDLSEGKPRIGQYISAFWEFEAKVVENLEDVLGKSLVNTKSE